MGHLLMLLHPTMIFQCREERSNLFQSLPFLLRQQVLGTWYYCILRRNPMDSSRRCDTGISKTATHRRTVSTIPVPVLPVG